MILADEPTGNLDSKTSVEIMELFQRLNREQGITVVFVTHDPETADYCQRVVHIRDGKVARDVRQVGRVADSSAPIAEVVPPETQAAPVEIEPTPTMLPAEQPSAVTMDDWSK